jgi:hypothetical protein
MTLFFFTPVNPMIYPCVLGDDSGAQKKQTMNTVGPLLQFQGQKTSMGGKVSYDLIKMRISQSKGCSKYLQ